MFLLRVCRCLADHDIPYAIVGGHAVALHGAPRGTLDVDVVIEHSRVHFRAAEEALRSLGLTPYLPLSADYVFTHRQRLQEERNLIAWSFVNQAKPMEIVDIIIAHDLKEFEVETKTLDGTPVRLLSLGSLVEMKSQTQRAQDAADAQALEQLREEK